VRRDEVADVGGVDGGVLDFEVFEAREVDGVCGVLFAAVAAASAGFVGALEEVVVGVRGGECGEGFLEFIGCLLGRATAAAGAVVVAVGWSDEVG